MKTRIRKMDGALKVFHVQTDGTEVYAYTLVGLTNEIARPHRGSSLDVIAFSDYRSQSIPDLIAHVKAGPKPHLILYGGDDLDRFHADERNYFQELANCSRYGLCAVAGNDDPEPARAFISGKNVFNVHSCALLLGNFAIVGLEGAPAFPTGFGENMNIGHLLYPEPILTGVIQCWNRFSDKHLIVVSHAPPYNTLDFARRFGTRHIGSRPLRSFLEQDSNPAVLCVCGHVHSLGARSDQVGSCTVVNAASNDRHGEPGRVARIAIRAGRVESVTWDHLY